MVAQAAPGTPTPSQAPLKEMVEAEARVGWRAIAGGKRNRGKHGYKRDSPGGHGHNHGHNHGAQQAAPAAPVRKKS